MVGWHATRQEAALKTTSSRENWPIRAAGRISRRQFVAIAGGATAGVALASCTSGTGSEGAETAQNAGPTSTVATQNARPTSTVATRNAGPTSTVATSLGRPVLSIPQRLQGSTFELAMATGQREFVAGLSTPTKGYNGDFLGPTLVVRTGSDVALNVTNNIGVTTTTHWHGMHVPAAMDGGPHQPIEPDQTWPAAFRVMNRAGTYWYHSHLHDPSLGPESTGYQVYEGLAGLLIVEDDLSDSLPLPRSYGQDDIPLILQDRGFDTDGSFLHFAAAVQDAGRRGNHFLVNGVEGAVLEVGAQVVRLRVLNASNSRIYNLGFSDDRTFNQIASDGGFLNNPVPMSRLILAPGERAELLIDLSAEEGQTFALGSYNAGNGNVFLPTQLQDEWDTADFELLEIRVGPTTPDAVTGVPSILTDVARIHESEAVNAANPRTFELNVRPFRINGQPMDMSVINERIALGDTEIWEITNPNPMAHPFHVHGDSFQILSRDGVAPPDHELGWKDVVLTRPFETIRIIKRFHDYADPQIPYMYHCHILEHEDRGMMGQWVVEAP